MNILICEDNPIIAMDLRWMLEDMGHRVCGIADTALKGIEECAAAKPDLVMVDLHLAEGRTGLVLVRTLADHRIPSIIVSGETHTLPKVTRAKAVISKPFSEATLAKVLAVVEADLQVDVASEPAPEASREGSTVAGLRRLLRPRLK